MKTSARFRIRFAFVFVRVAVMLFALLLCVKFASLSNGKANDWRFWLGLVESSVLASLLTCWMWRKTCPVQVSPTGISGHSLHAFPMQLRWENITQVRKVYFLVFPYLQITSTSEINEMWLPLFLDDFASFREAVLQCSPSENPLQNALN